MVDVSTDDFSNKTRSDTSNDLSSKQSVEHDNEHPTNDWDTFSSILLVRASSSAEVFSTLRELATGTDYFKQGAIIIFENY